MAGNHRIALVVYLLCFAIAAQMFLRGNREDALTFLIGAALLLALARFGGGK